MLSKRTVFVTLFAGLILIVACVLTGCPESGEEDPTANWETFTNMEFGYSVQHPPDFEAALQEGTNVLTLRENADMSPSRDDYQIKVSVVQNPDGLSIEEYFDGDPGSDLMSSTGGNFTVIEAQRHTVLKFLPNNCTCTVAIIQRPEDFIVVLSVNVDNRDIFDTVIQSFEI